MQRRFKQMICSVRERTCFNYAQVATIGGFCDLDILVLKATSPDDLPVPERYVNELLKVFSISPSSIRAFLFSFVHRFGKTQSWRVALKCLFLLHRLLRSMPDDSLFRAELLTTRANALLSLYPCHFKDCSSSYSQDYTSFIRSYAHLLDEALVLSPIAAKRDEEEQEVVAIPEKVKEAESMIRVLPQLQSLTDRVMHCRPTGAAARSFVVQSAMKYIIRDSFNCYATFRNEIVVVLDNLIRLPYQSSVAAFDIYKKAALQADQLYEFYDWCKSMGFCGSYEYPFVDRIPHIQIEALGSFLNGMWQSSSSSTSSHIESTSQSPLSLTEDDTDKPLFISDIISTNKNGNSIHETPIMCGNDWAKFDELDTNKELERKKDMDPLIEFEVDNIGWEALLEASITTTSVVSESKMYFPPDEYGHHYQYGKYSVNGSLDHANCWQMQIYKPRTPHASNPFQQPRNTPAHYGSYQSKPRHTDSDPLTIL